MTAIYQVYLNQSTDIAKLVTFADFFLYTMTLWIFIGPVRDFLPIGQDVTLVTFVWREKTFSIPIGWSLVRNRYYEDNLVRNKRNKRGNKTLSKWTHILLPNQNFLLWKRDYLMLKKNCLVREFCCENEII